MKTVKAAVQLSPVLYKGSEYDSSNYRKISITCSDHTQTP